MNNNVQVKWEAVKVRRGVIMYSPKRITNDDPANLHMNRKLALVPEPPQEENTEKPVVIERNDVPSEG